MNRVRTGTSRVPSAHLGANVGTEVEDAGTPGRARAGTLTAIGTMAAVAIVSVTAVVAWARLGQPAGGAEAAAAVEEVPTALAGGDPPQPVPDGVAAAVDRPVIGAARLDHLPGEMLAACTEEHNISWEDVGGPEVEYAFITPDGVVAALAGPGDLVGDMDMGPEGQAATGIRLTCDLELQEGSPINRGGGSFEHIFPDQPRGGGGFMSSSCCDERGLATATAGVDVPAEAEWLLQDRGTWFLAYDVEGLEGVGVSWKYREHRFGQGGPPISTVLFVGEDGSIVAEATAGGQF